MYGNIIGIPWATANTNALMTTPARRPKRARMDPWIIPRKSISSQNGVNPATARKKESQQWADICCQGAGPVRIAAGVDSRDYENKPVGDENSHEDCWDLPK